MPLSYFLPILNHESENPKCSFFYRPVKCEISPFPPMSGTSPFPLCVCTGKALLAWPGCCVWAQSLRWLLPVGLKAWHLSLAASELTRKALLFSIFIHMWQLISQYQ